MCRLLLILNDSINKKYILSFLKQSITKKNTPYIDSDRDCDYHKDGFGLAWISNINNKWMIYKNEECFTENDNIKTIINSINSNIFIGHLRAKCKNSDALKSYHNTHPFIYQDNIWCHNGCITNFNEFKKINKDNILNKYHQNIKGNTDSEFLFYMFLTISNKNNKLNELINTTIKFFKYIYNYEKSISANIIYSNNDYVLISRYLNLEDESPSLYLSKNDKMIISSEPLTKDFTIIPNKTAFIIDIKKQEIVYKLNLKNI